MKDGEFQKFMQNHNYESGALRGKQDILKELKEEGAITDNVYYTKLKTMDSLYENLQTKIDVMETKLNVEAT